MSDLSPVIDPRIALIAPGFRALSIKACVGGLLYPDVAEQAQDRACQAARDGDPRWAEAHLAAWAEAFRAFGAKPQRTPCSAEALRKRVLRDGRLPTINPIVDLYNAVSVHYAVPVGGENLAAYRGAPRLALAEGTEPFDTVKEGRPAQEAPEPGEVVWRDDIGVTCRRWNWRQGTRTRLDSNTREMWFILESLPAMPLKALYEAGDTLAQGIERMFAEARIDTRLLEVEPSAQRD